MLIYSNELMPTVVLNLDKMGGMIFWRLIIVSRQKDCKFNYMLILCSGSFLSTALHILTVYNFTCRGAFFLHRSSPEKQIVIRKISLETYSILFFSFFNWEIIFFLSNNYKPILGVGKGKNFRNANLQIRTNVIVMISQE